MLPVASGQRHVSPAPGAGCSSSLSRRDHLVLFAPYRIGAMAHKSEPSSIPAQEKSAAIIPARGGRVNRNANRAVGRSRHCAAAATWHGLPAPFGGCVMPGDFGDGGWGRNGGLGHMRSFPLARAAGEGGARARRAWEGEGDRLPCYVTGMTIGKARQLRVVMTDAGRRLWSVLRGRRLHGFKFRRQHPLGPYVLDFACVEHRLVIEADGGQHADCRRDQRRTAWLEARGWRVVRFWNNEILANTEGVQDAILRALGSAG